MMRFKYVHTAALVMFALATSAGPSAQAGKPLSSEETRETNLRAYVELLRSDLRTQKLAIVSELMQLSDADDAKFWPIYREYEGELAALNDGRIALIQEYADNYGKMTNDVADRLARAALDGEAKRTALKQKYYDRLAKTLSPIAAARFFQVENQILLLLDLQISASLPLVQEQ
jgi:hypothetical protein